METGDESFGSGSRVRGLLYARRFSHDESSAALFVDNGALDAQNSSLVGILDSTSSLHFCTLMTSSRSRNGWLPKFRLSGLGR